MSVRTKMITYLNEQSRVVEFNYVTTCFIKLFTSLTRALNIINNILNHFKGEISLSLSYTPFYISL